MPVSRRDGVRQDICMWLDEKARVLMACQDFMKRCFCVGIAGQVWPHLNEEERKKVKTRANSRCCILSVNFR